MKAPFSALTQSRFFHTGFNSAIFDGPVRIYFVQFHEDIALRIYFALQDQLSSWFNSLKDYDRSFGSTVLLMVYPTEADFHNAFPHYSREQEIFMAQDMWEGEKVFGVMAEKVEEQLQTIVDRFRQIFEDHSLMRGRFEETGYIDPGPPDVAI